MARQRRTITPAPEKTAKPKKKTRHLRRAAVLATIVILLVITLVALGLVSVRYLLGTAQQSTTVTLDTDISDEYRVGTGTESSDNRGSGPRDGAIDYLLVGADSRVDMQGNPLPPDLAEQLRAGNVETTNTDVIMVLRVAGDGSQASVISIPRDTYIKDRTYGNTKINAVYARHQADANTDSSAEGNKQAADAGRKGLVEAVSSLTGVTIDHYVEVGLVGFALFTDAVGGVDVCLNNATTDPMTGASFAAGQQTLGGADALSFVRQRYGLTNGDLDRVKRQQAYLGSLANKLLSAGTLTNPRKLNELVDAVEKSVAIDSNLDMVSAITSMSKIKPSEITFETIPVVTIAGVGDNGESVVEVDVRTVQNFFAARAGEKAPKTTDRVGIDLGDTSKLPEDMVAVTAVPSARVFSAGNSLSPAKDAAKILSDDGVVVTDIAMAPAQWSGSGAQVLVQSSSPSAQRIAELLDLPIVEQSSVPQGSIVVITGTPASTTAPQDMAIVGDNFSGPARSEPGDRTAVDEGTVCVD